MRSAATPTEPANIVETFGRSDECEQPRQAAAQPPPTALESSSVVAFSLASWRLSFCNRRR
jgi:hypothetical protein